MVTGSQEMGTGSHFCSLIGGGLLPYQPETSRKLGNSFVFLGIKRGFILFRAQVGREQSWLGGPPQLERVNGLIQVDTPGLE